MHNPPQDEHPARRLIPGKEAAEMLGIDRSTLSRWVNANPPKIQYVRKLEGKRGPYLFDPDEIERHVRGSAA